MGKLMHSRPWTCGFALTALAALSASADSAPPPSSAATERPASASPHYAYATNGIEDHIEGGLGSEWKRLVDASNLGGHELEMVEVTLSPGTAVPAHLHGSVEVIYVLSGIYDHEVNGRRYRLTPGMVGIVRPGDKVRHLVPKSGPARLLIIWAPGGEEARVLGKAKGAPVAPVTEYSTESP